MSANEKLLLQTSSEDAETTKSRVSELQHQLENLKVTRRLHIVKIFFIYDICADRFFCVDITDILLKPGS